MQKSVLAGVVAGLVTAGAMNVAAAAGTWPEAGDFVLRGGFHTIDPKGGSFDGGEGAPSLQVREDTSFTFSGTYFFTPAIAVELQAATPFNHDIDIVGAGKAASTRHLPPTLSVQYHVPFGDFKPYVGLGLNWTIFFDESTVGPLSGADLNLDDSFGVAAQLGVDYALSDRWYLNGEIRWIDIDTDAKVNGGTLGSVEIDPFVWALTVGRRF
ncbi:MAG: outer membrane beta-barrel protein [Chromatiales bacterium]|jgi:outer membrane protein|nr:outer membrane beta-barrel protein [Chromatiales bacterium]